MTPPRRLWIAIVLALIVGGCAGRVMAPTAPPGRPDLHPGRPDIHPGRPLRVGVVLEAAALDLACGQPAIVERSSGMVLGRFRRLRITPADSGMAVEPAGAEARVFADTLRFEPASGQALAVNGVAYRGGIEVFSDGRGTLTAVNRVDLEDYLLGVVPLEIGNPGPASQEAIRAQAVAARTYAVAHLERWPELGFDLYGDVRDQAYGGTAAERPVTSQAVAATTGIVATYHGELIGAYYSAACGGMTAAVDETWNYPPEDYLRPRKDRRGGADFCRFSKNYRWQERWSASDFMDLLSRYLPAEFGSSSPGGELEDVQVVARNSSGRVRRLEVALGGRRVAIGGDRVRWVLRRPGGSILRSSAFEIHVERQGGRVEAVVADGAGNGHGVGMCQAGAIQMAAEGYNCQEILSHYYPGTRLSRLREPRLLGQNGFGPRNSLGARVTLSPSPDRQSFPTPGRGL